MDLFDPDELVRLARRIDEHADALRQRGRALSCAAQTARWHSPAAACFHEQVDGLDRKVQHAAHNVERAATQLRAHARRVRTAERLVATATRTERDAVRIGEHAVRGATQEIRHAAGWLEHHL